jgi:DNA-binding MarR family transcriptional regulator
MTRAQWVILARLARQAGLSQNELAAVCEVEPISVGRLIDRLESRGLVERRSDPGDRRIRRLHLLPAAQPVLEEIGRYRQELSGSLLNGVEGAAREALIEALLVIKNNLNSTDTAHWPQLAAGG